MSLFIAHLSIADLSVAIFNVAPNLCEIVSFPKNCPLQTNTIGCKITGYMSLVPIYGSTYVLVVATFDRFLAMNYPFKAQRLNSKHVHLMSGIAWVAAFIFSSPQLFIFKYNEETQYCLAEWISHPVIHSKLAAGYAIWFALAIWILPTVVIVFCYGNIVLTVWRSERSCTRAQHLEKSKIIKPLQITLAIVIGYLICWSPWMVATLVLQFNATANVMCE
ncbi:arg8-vasotocin receptor-like [Watersipora subatra]|uniref:arg8-vasotocin receptor-like n=1 Tax=Watersipora subatra TaxID=2589382 RepID=UPI00355B7614